MISKFTTAAKSALTGALLFFVMQTANAQVVKTENFDFTMAGVTWPNTDLPFGWVQGKLTPSTDPNNYWDRCNAATGVNPTCSPQAGSTGMMRFRSNYVTATGETGYLVSRKYDLSARGAVTASTLSFWVYRDNTYSGNDVMQVQVHNGVDPAIGTPLTLTEGGGATSIPRNCLAIPPAVCNTWVQYTYTIPAGAVWSTNSIYIIIRVADGGNSPVGGNYYIDSFSIQTYPSAQSLVSIGLDFQNVLNVSVNTTNNMIIGCRVTVNNEASFCPLGAFTFTHNGTTSPATDVWNSGTGGVKLWWTGGTNTFSTNALGQPINALQVGTYAGANFPVPNFAITPSAPGVAAMGGGLHNGNNYFWLTYDCPSSAIGNNYLDADFISVNLGASCGNTTICGGLGCSLSGARLIDVAYCVPTYVAGTSWLNGSYTNNDYVKYFICAGDPAYPPGINNDHNDTGPNLGGSNNHVCGPCSGGNCPFSVHPPDYQKFGTVAEPNFCPQSPGGLNGRTAVFLVTPTSPPANAFTVRCGTWYGSNYIAAWIDLNHDGIFNNAPIPGGERVFHSGNMNALATFSGSFTLPYAGASQYYGQTTMRVREWYANPNMDPCGAGYYGEVEDYTVTLRPDCSPLWPGWKIWLGYTDDWNVNSNWCGGVPTINDHALIPGKGAAAYNRGPNTYHPVIKSGVLATTRKLLMLNDTVEANAPVPGSLRVCDSLLIGRASSPNTSALIVDSSFNASAILSNGVNINTTWLPFRQSFREQKVQLMYKTTELTAQGLATNDVIDAIVIPIRVRRSTAPYPATIKMYYATNNPTYPSFINVGWTMPIPVHPANCLAPQFSAPQTVYTGNIDFTGIPLNGAGTLTVNISPFTFTNNPATPLIVEICYSMPATSLNDDTWQTQTVGYRSFLQLANLGAYPVAACLFQTTQPNGSTNLTQRQASDLRPNLTFLFHRVYTKFPIQLEYNATGATTGQWANFGSFIPANSIVEFKGTTLVTQNIGGINPTTFDELKINTGAGNVRQQLPATVNDTLWLTQGRLYLNALTLTLMNNSLGAITRTSGYLQSEDLPPNYGLLNWKMGSTLGAHVIPFWSTTAPGSYIPFTYTATGGTSDLTIGTYYPSTNPAQMLPWPTGVTTINSYNDPTISDAPNLVKRYWVMGNAGTAPTADLAFSYLTSGPSEEPTNGAGFYVAQRWDNTGAPIPGYLSTGPGWWPGIVGGTGPLNVPVPGVNMTDIVWVLALQPEPLPVSLLSFTARPEKDKVRLDWTTVSEKNNSHFTVERTANTTSYDWIAEVLSHGASTSVQEYYTYDEKPLMGLQFYRLKQTDLNGEEAYSKLIPVEFGEETSTDDAFEIMYVKNLDNGYTDIVFNSNSELPYSYKVVDMTGRIVLNKSNIVATHGFNLITLDNNFSEGVYTISIYNQQESLTRKIFK